MNRKYRISSPQVFETAFTQSKIFQKHEWLFDVHPGKVSSFQPDVRVSFDYNPALTLGQFGHVATIDRLLAAHPSFALGGDEMSLADLEAQTYVTITHDDDAFLSVTSVDGAKTPLRPSKVFRANDVRAAELAVKLKIGYSALPDFLLDDNTNEDELSTAYLKGWKISPTYLRIISSGPPDRHLSELHKALLSALSPLINTPWRSFGQTENIIPLVNSNA